MRTLVDLLNNEHGYARIFAEIEGFSYELSTYTPAPVGDLFERMAGFTSASDACEAARQQLCSIRQARHKRVASPRTKRTRQRPASPFSTLSTAR